MRIMRVARAMLALAMLCRAAGASDVRPAIVTALYSSNIAPYREVVQGFRELMQSLEIPLLIFERDVSEETPASFSSHIVEKQPQAVLALGTRAARFCREHAGAVPVIFTMVLEADSFVGDNRTGVTLHIPAGERLRLLRAILPAATRIGVIHAAAGQAARMELERDAPRQGFSVVSRSITAPGEFPSALSALLSAVDCLVMVADPSVYNPQSVEFLLKSALQHRVPVVGLSSVYTRAGALLSFDCSYHDIGRQAAQLTMRLLAGEAAASIVPQAPETVTYSLNVSVARQLGISLPRAVLTGAGALFGQ